MRRLGIVGLLAAGGCAGSEACVDFTEEVIVVAALSDEGDGMRVEVALQRAEAGADSIPVKLCQGNRLAFDGLDLEGVKRPSGAVVYEAELGSKKATEAVVHRLTLDNDDGVSEFAAEIDAPRFEISAPVADAEVPRTAPLEVMWSPAAGAEATITLRVADEIDGESCLAAPYAADVPDDGEATVEAGTIALAAGKSPKATCEAFVTLSRRASVALEKTQGGATLHPDSRMEATNSRVQPFRSTP
jgi:hypothetical protein